MNFGALGTCFFLKLVPLAPFYFFHFQLQREFFSKLVYNTNESRLMHLKSRFKIAEISFCNNQSPYFFLKFGENYYDIDTACQFLAQVPAFSKFQRMLPHINSQIEKPEQEEILVLTLDGNWHTPDAAGAFLACLNFNWNNNYERLELNYNRTDNTNEQWGAASGFRALCFYQTQKLP